MPRAVVRLVNIFILHIIRRSKINESLPNMIPNKMLLDVNV
jgi:hypothetical protein